MNKKLKQIDEAWLKLDVDDKDLFNPMSILNSAEDDYHLKLSWLMTRPEYFSFLVKHIFNIQILPSQALILHELWNRKFPMLIASRGFGKSFMLSLYSMLRALLLPNRKVVVVGAAFRQSKVLFEYMETIWNNSPILRDICDANSGPRRDVDRCVMRINDSRVTCLPLGDGQKIRGQRANDIISDEFASIPRDIFETVVAGFAAVSAKPTDNVKKAAKRRKMQAEGRWTENQEDEYKERQQNQSILAGTCGYDFEPFADYWKKYCSTIKNKGDFRRMADNTENGDVPDYMKRLDWTQFSVIRIPYELIPEGFMDDQQVTRARATMHNGIYQMEYGACFTTDSQGFFRRSLIEAATAHNKNVEKPEWPSYCPSVFDVTTRGQQDRQYVYGIDPASEQDNFALIIIELHPEHHRLVYSWTTNKKDFQARMRMGLTDVSDYYSFCVRKVRELMRVFPCSRIGIDSQGGGFAIAEGLADEDKLQPGERKILPIIEDNKKKPTDDIAGDHILEYINFASAEWTSKANHGLRKDIEDKVLLFPRFDTVTLSLMTEKDKMQFKSLKETYGDSAALKLYDTLEDCVMDIEELKSELTTVVVSVTSNGRERFDTPEIKLDTGKKGRMRKDRYSALVIANMIARSMQRAIPAPTYVNIGRIIGQGGKNEQTDSRMYVGPEWAQSYTPGTCFMVKKNN